MNWIELTETSQLEAIQQLSHEKAVVIFKHSTRCSISAMAKNRLDRSTEPGNTVFYYLDLLKYRPISNLVAEKWHVHHESPQVLLIRNGECVYDESHNGITIEDIAEQIA